MRYLVTNLYIVRVAAVVLADALCLVAAATAACVWLDPVLAPLPLGVAVGVGTLASFIALYFSDAYRLTLMGDVRQTRHALLAAAGLGLLGAVAVYYWVPLPEGAKPLLMMTCGLYFPLLFGERLLVREIYGRTGHRVAILGTGELALSVAEALSERTKMGFEFVGFITEAAERLPIEYPVLGDMDEFEKIIERSSIDTVVVAVQDRSLPFPASELLDAKLRGVRVESGVSLYERMTGRVFLRYVRPSYLIFSDGFRMNRVSAAIKRAMDVAGAGLGLSLAAPLLGLAALAIRLDSRGSVFYRQARVGRGGRTFQVMKLRSMVDQAEAASGPVWARGKQDARVTRVGRILRRTRLDEIPQLWNVLVGDMSLVGPRPERPEFVKILSDKYPYFQLRSTIRPGLTGWAQVRHGYVNDVAGAEEKLALDLFYLKYQSVFLDLLILWKTLRTVVLLQGI